MRNVKGNIKKKQDILSSILFRLKEILENKPSLDKMKEDIKEMGLFVRSVEGNPMIIKKIKEEKMIEILWTLGKIDILLENHFHLLDQEEQNFVFNSFEKIKESLISEIDPYFSPEDINEHKDFSSYLLLEFSRRNRTKRNLN